MPMLDAYIPKGAFAPKVENELISTLTDLLLKWEGADPTHEATRAIAWVFLHRPETVYVAGSPADEPRYKLVVSVPEGQLDNERRKGMVEALTKAVLDAEPDERERDPFRVWVFATQIPEGTWGGGGRIFKLADIAAMATGDRKLGVEHAQKRLAISKSERDEIFAN
jgi:phenylpyruvate tautomerase PptA (4-oxalocrotonate tautomerase family)